MVTALYETRILNGECIVVIFKPEGVAYAKEKYPKLNLYSIREIEAFEGLEVLEQKMLLLQPLHGTKYCQQALLSSSTLDTVHRIYVRLVALVLRRSLNRTKPNQ